MNARFKFLETSADSIRAALPKPPTDDLRQKINRAIQLLPLRGRWRNAPLASLLALTGVVCIVVTLLTRADLPALCGSICVAAALVFILRLAPSQIETQVLQTERDADALLRGYEATCRKVGETFCKGQLATLNTIATTALSDGSTLTDIRTDIEAVEHTQRASEQTLTAQLEQQRVTVKQLRENYQRHRARLSTMVKKLRAQFFPSGARGAARDALDALAKLDEALGEEVLLQIAAQSIHSLAETATALGRKYNAILTPAAADHEDSVPYWLGIALPPADLVQAGGISKANQHLRQFRESVVRATTEDKPSQEVISETVDALFSTDLPWPTTVEDYVASLNGETKFFADRLCKNGDEFTPSTPIPGRDRHRKLFCLTANGPNSVTCKALKERIPDAVGVVGLEHARDEILVVVEERNVVLGELPEAKACIEAFRSLPREKQSLLISAVEDDAQIANYYPDLGEDHSRPSRVLACALALAIVARSGSQEYEFAGRAFAKGFQNAIDALRLDQRLLARIAGKVDEVAARDGHAAVTAKLAAAGEQPTVFVPKEAVEEFKTAIDDGITEFHHLAARASNVK